MHLHLRSLCGSRPFPRRTVFSFFTSQRGHLRPIDHASVHLDRIVPRLEATRRAQQIDNDCCHFCPKVDVETRSSHGATRPELMTKRAQQASIFCADASMMQLYASHSASENESKSSNYAVVGDDVSLSALRPVRPTQMAQASEPSDVACLATS